MTSVRGSGVNERRRSFHTFAWKDANYRFRGGSPRAVRRDLVARREELEAYIARYPLFQTSLVPIPAAPGAPAVALAMHRAAELAGVGPMAAVAGAMAESALRAARAEVVENGGDIFLWADCPLTIGLYAGGSSLSGRLALRVEPARMPLAVCSSSGTMGHSFSFGRCDLATVVAGDGALADAAATLAGNLVTSADDIPAALERVCAIPGVAGVLLVKGERVGLKGDLPPLVAVSDPAFADKITRDRRSGFAPA